MTKILIPKVPERAEGWRHKNLRGSKTCGFHIGLALRFAVPASNSASSRFKPQDFAFPLWRNQWLPMPSLEVDRDRIE
jgi:hypothetical protein